MMDHEHSSMAMNAICRAAFLSGEAIQQAAYGYGTPSAIYRPRLFVDGDEWCALYGDDLQNGVAGFGASPREAMAAFDEAWCSDLPAREAGR